MIVDKILNDCWQERYPYLLSQEAIIEFFVFFKNYLEKKLSGLSEIDQLSLASIYLKLLGYAEQDVVLNEKTIKIKYELPGHIQLAGIAILEQMISELSLLSADFYIVFDFDAKNPKSDLLSGQKALMVHFQDCVRILGAILALRLYSDLKHQISQNQDLMKWFFDYVNTIWGISKDDLGEIGNRWNSFSQLKIEWHSLNL